MAKRTRSQLSAPTQAIFIISLLLAVAGVVLTVTPLVPTIAGQAWWLVVVGYVLLSTGVLFKGV